MTEIYRDNWAFQQGVTFLQSLFAARQFFSLSLSHRPTSAVQLFIPCRPGLSCLYHLCPLIYWLRYFYFPSHSAHVLLTRYIARCSNDLFLDVLRNSLRPRHSRSHVLSSNFWLSFATLSYGVYFSRVLIGNYMLRGIVPNKTIRNVSVLHFVILFNVCLKIFFAGKERKKRIFYKIIK